MPDANNMIIRQRVIVVVEAVDRVCLKQLRFALAMSNDVMAFSMVTDEEKEIELKASWRRLGVSIPYVIRRSADKHVSSSLLEYLQSAENGLGKNEIITVILPRLVAGKWWRRLLQEDRNGASAWRNPNMPANIVIMEIPYAMDGS